MRQHISVEVRSLTKDFGGVTAVDDVSFRHDTGGVIGLIGPNGAGKTTLFNILSGADKPTSGSIALDGQDVTGQAPYKMNHRGVARTFQNLEVFTSLTVAENVMISRQRFMARGPLLSMITPAHSGNVRRQREYVQNLLEQAGVGEYADEFVGNLPYGDQRRVEIARAMATEPKLLLLDEPLAGLSRAESVGLTELMTQTATDGVTIVLVEHDVASVMGVSDRVLVLNTGQLLADGTAAQIQDDPRVQAAYLGVAPESTAEPATDNTAGRNAE